MVFKNLKKHLTTHKCQHILTIEPKLVMKKIIIQNSKYAKEQEVGIMPLTMANIGEVNEIKRIGGNEETRRFLANLGFVAGAEITVVSAIGGNVIVNIKDSRVAVNSDMARHIMIQPLAGRWVRCIYILYYEA